MRAGDRPTHTDSWYAGNRIAGLARFAAAITALNVAGHAYLGFEPSWATPLAAVATAYATELLAETLEAWTLRRRVRFAGSFATLVTFLLPAHITGLAVGMLLYSPDSLWPIVFGVSAAIVSKYVVRVRAGVDASGGAAFKHVLNPSNFGIALTLLLMRHVGVAAPYQFSENTSGVWDWVVPFAVICLGSLLNTRLTRRMPLIGAWLGVFALQALARAIVHGTPLVSGLVPMTGFAFILFTFYMVTDPGTTPSRPIRQVAFGAGVALAYAALMELHVVFTLFFALALVSAARGVLMALAAAAARVRRAPTVEVTAAASPRLAAASQYAVD
jgi:hypothetical protein